MYNPLQSLIKGELNISHQNTIMLLKFIILLFSLAFDLSRAELNSPKIVGGEPADIKNYAHQLSLQYFKKHFCGASLISKQIALSAAHCTFDKNIKNLSVRSGSTYHDRNGEVTKVVKVINHEQYDPETANYDVSLIVLAYPIENAKIIPISTKPIAAGVDVTVTGWGAIYHNGPYSESLLRVTLKSIAHDDCIKAFPDNLISEYMICTKTAGKDACKGDSGGPLIIEGGEQVGIVSFSHGCASEFPGVYADVYSLRNWITTNMKMLN